MIADEKFLSCYQKFIEIGLYKILDYDKFSLYSIITHSTAIEGSTVTEGENALLFDSDIPSVKRTMTELLMNKDLKSAYEKSKEFALFHADITVDMLKELSSLVMKNTGSVYKTITGEFSAAKGDFRLLNVSAGRASSSYMDYRKVCDALKKFCDKLNDKRHNVHKNDIISLYNMSFDAHYELVTIHPWADGNGRVSRLLMNQIQEEFGLVRSKVKVEMKNEYISALRGAQDASDAKIFCDFMKDAHARDMMAQIEEYEKSIG